MQATNFQSGFRNIFTEMKLDILQNSETNLDCLVLKINAKFILSEEEGSPEAKIFSLTLIFCLF